jgi:hypothetical protein
MITAKLVVLSLFLHVLMTGAIGITLLRTRLAALRRGRAKAEEVAIDAWAWPSQVRKIGNCFSSQFELPMFWYAIAGFAVATGRADILMAVLSWLFLGSRMVHAFVHLGQNHLPVRLGAFLTGFAIVVLMWLWFCFQFFLAG